jgi:hypothetical protein
LLCGDKSQQTRGKYTFTHICQILIVIRSFFSMNCFNLLPCYDVVYIFADPILSCGFYGSDVDRVKERRGQSATVSACQELMCMTTRTSTTCAT